MREVRIVAEDWPRVAAFLDAGEERLGRSAGWLVENQFDLPCTVFLTDRRLVLSIHPWLLSNPGRIVESSFDRVRKCGIGSAGRGRARLVYLAAPINTQDPFEVDGFVIDLPRGREGRRFGELVARTVGKP